MISLVSVTVNGPKALSLAFSDGSSGIWSGADVIARDTVLTRALADPAYFARAFVEGEGLAWPNGLEFSAMALQQKLNVAGALTR